MLKDNRIDLIISDVMMPGMGGYEFISRMREEERYQNLPVIFLSAKSDEKDVATGLSSGADIYLSKPIGKKMLLAQITAVLRREQIIRQKSLETEDEDEPQIKKTIRELIYRQLANPALNVSQIAESLYISRTSLYREWKNTDEVSLSQYIRNIRMKEAYTLITEKGFSVNEAARATGYTEPGYFSTTFKKVYGKSPSEIKEE